MPATPPFAPRSLSALLAAALILPTTSAFSADPTITIQAGEQDRTNTVVTFTLGDKWHDKTLSAKETDVPVQVDSEGRASFILPSLAKGTSRTLTLVPASPVGNSTSGIDVVPGDGSLNLVAKSTGDTIPNLSTLIATYQMTPGPVPAGTSEAFAHGAHLHPVYSPSGKLLTGNHPPDHPHQRGIWMSWTKTEFGAGHPDFWNMGKDKSGKLTGEIRFDKLLNHWSGPVHGGFTSTHRWLDHTTGTEREVMLETWDLKAYHTMGHPDTAAATPPSSEKEKGKLPGVYLLDLTSTQTVTGQEPLKLPKYHYGGLGVRGSALWDAVDQVTMLTSSGHDRKTGDATKARWVWLGGEVEGTPTGITVLIHPDNFRFPQPLRLNPKNPQLCVAPSADGDWSIEPGKPLVLKYRFVLMDGKPDANELERLWMDYAQPPKVEVK
ncbi:methane monooxygenase PmoA-like [Roseimicrobium gellanilyticum]|uniref:Methane monooxygenase PmoA-like n=1 Tax=Roseimicrobium gellanilyticum TaxID=748857 RepID=A0A366HI61_9BACT|nr:PmoA family protein [Roseimicrobium gellanilyticum]RBP42458.1 methane monooxygenase PmoA-like [Roseimicrobium gellanilyticum]